jgi:NADPH:quinone reductase-like Zn-dependent oxidoreductase
LLIDKKLPAVLGANVAGEIVKVGDGAAWQVGEKVFGICYPHPESSDQGGLQEYSLLNANAIGKTPEGFSDEQVVTLPINIVTSWVALFTETGFGIPPPIAEESDFDYAQTSIVILGGGTNVGQLAVQFARAANFGKIIVVSGLSNTARLQSMGATHVVDRHGSPAEIAKKLREIAGQDGVTQLYSCAPLNLDLVVAALPVDKPSKLRALLPLEAAETEVLKSQRPHCNASFIDDLSNDFMAPHTEEFWASLPKWLKEGKIIPTEYEVIKGLDKVKEINEALDQYRDFGRSGAQTVVKI